MDFFDFVCEEFDCGCEEYLFFVFFVCGGDFEEGWYYWLWLVVRMCVFWLFVDCEVGYVECVLLVCCVDVVCIGVVVVDYDDVFVFGCDLVGYFVFCDCVVGFD